MSVGLAGGTRDIGDRVEELSFLWPRPQNPGAHPFRFLPGLHGAQTSLLNLLHLNLSGDRSSILLLILVPCFFLPFVWPMIPSFLVQRRAGA